MVDQYEGRGIRNLDLIYNSNVNLFKRPNTNRHSRPYGVVSFLTCFNASGFAERQLPATTFSIVLLQCAGVAVRTTTTKIFHDISSFYITLCFVFKFDYCVWKAKDNARLMVVDFACNFPFLFGFKNRNVDLMLFK